MENDIYLIFRIPFNEMGAHENNGNHNDNDDDKIIIICTREHKRWYIIFGIIVPNDDAKQLSYDSIYNIYFTNIRLFRSSTFTL